MQRRNSYADMGLVVATSVFICILVKCFLFGITWVSIFWMTLACVYFYVSWRYPSDSKLVKHSTTIFFVLSAIAIAGVAMFDKNARPVMHAFEGTGDTIKDVSVVESSDTLIEDTTQWEELTLDSLLQGSGEQPGDEVSDTVNNLI
jgi:hypothetical protein